MVAIGKFTSAVLWSKTAIFREVYRHIKMPPCHWAPWSFIPHIRTFKRGIWLYFCSRGSKITSLQNLNISKTYFRFLSWLIIFSLLEQKQSFMPLLKVLICGMNVQGTQRHDGIFILGFTSLKMAVLLHKTVLVNFPMATTVGQLKLHWFFFQKSCVGMVENKAKFWPWWHLVVNLHIKVNFYFFSI